MSKMILLMLVLTSTINVASPQSKNKKEKQRLTPSEAVLLAEKFIIENGYTDLPAAKDKKKIIPESVHPMTGE